MFLTYEHQENGLKNKDALKFLKCTSYFPADNLKGAYQSHEERYQAEQDAIHEIEKR